MELKDFIVTAISDISSAVAEADEKIRDVGGLVNPGGYVRTRSAPSLIENSFVAPRTTLNFDIAVSASKEGGGTAEAKAKIWVVEASVGGEGKMRSETVSRLTFSLDVVLPHDPSQAARVGKVKTIGS